MAERSAYRVGSLCSGYGGLDLGLELALGPIEHAWHVEYDKHPAAILAHHWPEVPNYGDVKHTDWAQVARVDWLTAGYPCQPFSHAGKRAGADDPRHLWPGVRDAVRLVRPRRVLLENVAGHLSLGFGQVLGDLAALGYDARWTCLRAADAGAPHGRARIFVVASDADHRGPRARRSGADGRGEPVDVVRSGPLSNPPCDGRGEGRPEPARLIGGPDAAERGMSVAPDPSGDTGRVGVGDTGPAPADAHGDGLESLGRLDSFGRDAHRCGGADVAWGDYEPAIRRWERVTGRPAPRPVEPARRGERLSPRFVEWMMGLPAGWVTDVPSLPRNAQLKALGNGVVPQQAALALRLLGVTAEAVAA